MNLIEYHDYFSSVNNPIIKNLLKNPSISLEIDFKFTDYECGCDFIGESHIIQKWDPTKLQFTETLNEAHYEEITRNALINYNFCEPNECFDDSINSARHQRTILADGISDKNIKEKIMNLKLKDISKIYKENINHAMDYEYFLEDEGYLEDIAQLLRMKKEQVFG